MEIRRDREMHLKLLVIFIEYIYFRLSRREKKLHWVTNLSLFEQWIMGNMLRLHPFVILMVGFMAEIEIYVFISTCIYENMKGDALAQMDFCLALCIAEVIYHEPYSTCQMSWNLLLQSFLLSRRGGFHLTKAKDWCSWDQTFWGYTYTYTVGATFIKQKSKFTLK